MSSLNYIEKQYFEDLFNMQIGYVMETFSNASFERFFRDVAGTNIYCDTYSYNGTSKANRLRAFWETEPDKLVAKVLTALLTKWAYDNQNDPQSLSNRNYIECQKIVDRLVDKKTSTTDNVETFLEKDFGDISFINLNIDSTLVPVLDTRLKEAMNCLQGEAPLSAVFMCGSILEGLLLACAQKKPRDFNMAESSPKDPRTGKTKPFHDWSLANFIDVAHELGFIREDVKKFGHALRDFRNYIHPYAQMLSGFQPDEHTAKICMQVLRAAIVGLKGTINE